MPADRVAEVKVRCAEIGPEHGLREEFSEDLCALIIGEAFELEAMIIDTKAGLVRVRIYTLCPARGCHHHATSKHLEFYSSARRDRVLLHLFDAILPLPLRVPRYCAQVQDGSPSASRRRGARLKLNRPAHRVIGHYGARGLSISTSSGTLPASGLN